MINNIIKAYVENSIILVAIPRSNTYVKKGRHITTVNNENNIIKFSVVIIST